MPAKAPPPVRMAAGTLLPAAWDSSPAMPLTIPAVSNMSRTQIQRGTLDWLGGEVVGRFTGGKFCGALSIIETAKSMRTITLSI